MIPTLQQHHNPQEAEEVEAQGLELPRKARKAKRRSSTSKGKMVGKLRIFQGLGEIWEVEPIFYAREFW